MPSTKHNSRELEQAMAEALESVEQRVRGAEGDQQDAEEAAAPDEAGAEGEAEDEAQGPSDEQRIAELKDQLLRLAADFDNYRKRTRRELDAALRTGSERLAVELLPALDNLTRALSHVEQQDDALTQGVRMVARQFSEALRAHEIVAFDSLGETFDPQWHEATSQVVTAEHRPGTVVAEISQGYRAGDRLLRPAQVVVAMAGAVADEQESTAEE